MHYRPMTIEDYDAAVALWLSTEGVRLRDADSREGVAKYLQRNPGLSFVAEVEENIVGTIMSGHDSHRGFIQHLAVAASHRNRGVGSQLVGICLKVLKNEGIQKSHLMILVENEAGKRFWSNLGWAFRTDIALYSFINGGGPNA